MTNKSINVIAPHFRLVRKPYYAHNSYHTLSRNKSPEKAPAQVVYSRFVLLSNGAVLFVIFSSSEQLLLLSTLNISFRNNLYGNNYLFIRKYWNTSGRCRCFTKAVIQDSKIFSLIWFFLNKERKKIGGSSCISQSLQVMDHKLVLPQFIDTCRWNTTDTFL